jgi:hypothetical protein
MLDLHICAVLLILAVFAKIVVTMRDRGRGVRGEGLWIVDCSTISFLPYPTTLLPLNPHEAAKIQRILHFLDLIGWR